MTNPFAHRFGRKTAMLLGCIPLTIAWLALALTENYTVWCVARFLSGLSYGSAYTVLPIYLGEVAADEIRGLMAFILVFMIKLGLILVYALGPHLTVSSLSYVALVPIVVFALACRWVPPSPYCLHSRGHVAETRMCVEHLRGLRGSVDRVAADEIVRIEMAKIEATLTERLTMRAAFCELYRNPTIRRNMWLMFCFVATVAASGSQALLSYAQVVFESGAPSDSSETSNATLTLSPATATILIGAVQLPAVVAGSFVVDSLGRRPLVLLSVAGTTLCNCGMGATFWMRRWLLRTDTEMETTMQWLMLAAMLSYFVFYVVGMCAVFSVFMGELFPTAVRTAASATLLSVVALLAALFGKLFQVVSDKCGIERSFGMFAVCGTVSLVYMWRRVPETKGLSLAEIQGDSLNKR